VSCLPEITPRWLKDTFLLGVDLTLDDGSPYPDIIFEQSINSAIATLEKELQIKICRTIIEEERHDLMNINADGWWLDKLNFGPILSPPKLAIKYGDFPLLKYPDSWVHVANARAAQVQIIPGAEGFSSYMWSGGIPFDYVTFARSSYFPGYFTWEYTAGMGYSEGEVDPVDNGTVTVTIPEDELMIDGDYRVTVNIYDSAGDLLDPQPKARVKNRRRGSFDVVLSGLEVAGAPHKMEWSTSGVPEDILHAIGYLAAMLPLDIAGDLIIGAGIASSSISVDGLSQSIGSTSSATNSGYGARILSFSKQLKAMLPRLRAQYRVYNFAVV